MSIQVKHLTKDFPKRSWKNFKVNQNRVLDDVDFKITDGSFHGFIGPNGAGKTTTIQAIIGLINKTEGEVLLDNKEVPQRVLNSAIGYIPHATIFPKDFTGLEFIMEMVRLYKIPLYSKPFSKKELHEKYESLDNKQLLKLLNSKDSLSFSKSSMMKRKMNDLDEIFNADRKSQADTQKQIDKLKEKIQKEETKELLLSKKFLENKDDESFKSEIVKELIKRDYNKYQSDPSISMEQKVIDLFREFGIFYAMNKNPNTYSSGMQKKILLIHALINNAKYFILDEPAANLDPDSRLELYSKLEELNKQGKTIFICSHILAEMQGYVNEITILVDGKVRHTGKISKTANLTSTYQKYTRDLKHKAALDADLNKFQTSGKIDKEEPVKTSKKPKKQTESEILDLQKKIKELQQDLEDDN